MIRYDRFWETLKNKNVSQYSLIEKHGFSPNTFTRMRKNVSLNLSTIDDLCRVLECEIGDIVEYVPNQEEETK